MHRVVIEPDGTVTLYIGAENWPFPIPIVKNSSGAWYFDTEAGKKEILYRRVGSNENDAIEILYSLVDAQRDYASELARWRQDQALRDEVPQRRRQAERVVLEDQRQRDAQSHRSAAGRPPPARATTCSRASRRPTTAITTAF